MTIRHSQSERITTALVLAALFAMFLSQPAQAASAIADLPSVFDRARLIHVKGRQYFPGQRQENGQPIPPVEIDTWIDRENGRTRQTQTSTSQRAQMSSQSGISTSTTVTVTEIICDGTYQMTVNHSAKTATFARVGDYYRDWATIRLARKIWSQLCGQAAPGANFTKAGQETLDGCPCDIWQWEAAHPLGGGSGGIMGASGMVRAGGRGPRGALAGPPGYSTRSQLWLSQDKGRLIRAQAWSRAQGGPWELQSEYPIIECDGEVPPGVFATEPPTGYAAKNTKATAPAADPWHRLMRMGANGRNVECGVLIAFTLDDGSVIAGWQSRGGPEDGTAERLFANLACGGPLPKLPIEIYGLQPAGPATGITYTGRHLAYTRKANRFTEWSLYVPSGTPPAIVKQAGYDALYRFHLDPKPNVQFGLTVEYGVLVKTADDFNQWVRRAMAELSDSGTAPPEVTYQKVVDLVRQIRDH